MNHPKFSVSYQVEEPISIQRVKVFLVASPVIAVPNQCINYTAVWRLYDTTCNRVQGKDTKAGCKDLFNWDCNVINLDFIDALL